MSTDDDLEILSQVVQRQGPEFVLEALRKANTKKRELTIISNVGLHPLPMEYIRGQIHIASHGNLDFTDILSVNRELDKIVLELKEVLFSEKWTDIYLLPFGHSAISIAIKMAVFRLLRIETTDIFYFGNGRYDYLKRDSRASILGLTSNLNDS